MWIQDEVHKVEIQLPFPVEKVTLDPESWIMKNPEMTTFGHQNC
jgi:hypothetical protein